MTRDLPQTSRIYHRATMIGPRGVSALCFDKPRAIDMRRATWTINDAAVTCPKCKLRLAATTPEPTPK